MNTILKTTLTSENPTGIHNQEMDLNVGEAPKFKSGDNIDLQTGPDDWKGAWNVLQTTWVLNSDKGWIQEVYVEKL